MTIKEYMTTGEAAKFLGVSVYTLKRWEKTKKLIPARNPFSNWRLYKKEDLEAVLANIGSTTTALRSSSSVVGKNIE